MSFISRIPQAKQNRKIKGREYQLQAQLGRNYCSISNCMVLVRQNGMHAKSPTFREAKLKGFTVTANFLAGTAGQLLLSPDLFIFLSSYVCTLCADFNHCK